MPSDLAMLALLTALGLAPAFTALGSFSRRLGRDWGSRPERELENLSVGEIEEQGSFSVGQGPLA